MDPTQNPPVPTKFVYSGMPETNAGWTEVKGSILNCGGNTGTYIGPNPGGDRRYIMSSGAEDYTVNPNDTVTIIASQLIARGTDNRNSVTKLIGYSATAWSIYNGGFFVGVQNISTEIPSSYSLGQNYPNPFNPITNVKFSIVNSGDVKLIVYDIMGKEVQTLVNERLQPGRTKHSFDGSTLNSGVYFYKLVTDGFTETKKMVLIK